MALPTTRDEFVEYCLRKLGKPVIQINISPEQVIDAYDEAILYFQENHMDGAERMFYKITVDQNFIDNRYVFLPNNILSVSELITIPGISSKDITFDYTYQMGSEVLWNMMKGGGTGLFDYVLLKQSLREIQFNTVGETSYKYNRHTGKFQVDIGTSRIAVGMVILLACNVMIDPEEYPGVYRDSWLIDYTTALLKLRWGGNMSKFQGVNLPGGVSLNGVEIYNQAEEEKQRLEQEIIDKWNLPLSFMVG